MIDMRRARAGGRHVEPSRICSNKQKVEYHSSTKKTKQLTDCTKVERREGTADATWTKIASKWKLEHLCCPHLAPTLCLGGRVADQEVDAGKGGAEQGGGRARP